MSAENIGGVSMDAEINLAPLEQGLKKYSELLNSVNTSLGLTEKGMTGLEESGRTTANSIDYLAARSKELESQLRQLDPSTKKFNDTAKNLNATLADLKAVHEQAAKATGSFSDATKKSETASRALGAALGYLGVQSIDAVVGKFIELSKEAVTLAVHFEGIQARAKVIFGSDFPQIEQSIGNLASQLRRSHVELLDFATGFATVLDSVGASAKQVDGYSESLTQLTVNLGKAFPDRSDAEIYNIISTGIEGNVRGLRQLGIVMTPHLLQLFANSEGIKTLVKDMTDEQLVMLRTQYLITQTTKLQQAGADSTGKMGDEIKSAKAAWEGLLTTFGMDISPFIVAASKAFTGMLSNWMTMIGDVGMAFYNLVGQGYGPKDLMQKADGELVHAGFRTDLTTAKAQQAWSTNQPGGPNYDPGTNTVPFGPAPILGQAGNDPNFWNNTGGGGGKDKELEYAKKVIDEISKTEKDITDSLKKQAEDNKKRTDALHDELEMKRTMGVLTKDEKAELDELNRRVVYGKDKVKDATEEWKKQSEAVKTLKDEVDKINQSMDDMRTKLKDNLASIDQATQDKLADNAKKNLADIAKAYNDAKELLKKAESDPNASTNQDEINQARLTVQQGDALMAGGRAGPDTSKEEAALAVLQAQTAGIQLTKTNLDALTPRNEADKKRIQDDLAQNTKDLADVQKQIKAVQDQITAKQVSPSDSASALGKLVAQDASTRIGTPIDQINAKTKIEDQQVKDDGAKAKLKAVKDYNKELDIQTSKLLTANDNLAAAQAAQKQAGKDLIKAMDEVTISATTNYALTDTATETHVKHELKYLGDLKAELDAVAKSYKAVADYMQNPTGAPGASKPAFAAGGPVFGSGGPTSDSVHALLSNGEHVLTAAEVSAAGGHSEIFRLRQALKSGVRLNLPRFAQGGPVTSNNNNSRSVKVTNHYHGVAANVMGSPSMIHWHARRAMR